MDVHKSCGAALVDLIVLVMALSWDSGNESGEDLVCLFPETLLMVLVAWSEPRAQRFLFSVSSQAFKT